MKNTRLIILQTAIEAIHRNGYAGLRIDKELAKIGITKGAFYHYFPSKESLLIAAIKEILGPEYVKPWRKIAEVENDVLGEISILLQKHIDQASRAEVKYGCIFNNLVHETAAEIQEVRVLLEAYSEKAKLYLKTALEKYKKQIPKFPGSAEDLANLIFAVYNGSNSMNKLYQKKTPYKKAVKALILLLT